MNLNHDSKPQTFQDVTNLYFVTMQEKIKRESHTSHKLR